MSAQPFTVQTKHGLVSCSEYSVCQNVFAQTSEWGIHCALCTHNKYHLDENSAFCISDNFKSQQTVKKAPADLMKKETVIEEVVRKLGLLDPELFKNGSTFLFQVTVEGPVIDIGVVDNLLYAKEKLAQVMDHLNKATGVIFKET